MVGGGGGGRVTERKPEHQRFSPAHWIQRPLTVSQRVTWGKCMIWQRDRKLEEKYNPA